MPLEQMQTAVDLLGEFDSLSHQKDGADAPGTEPPDATGLFIVDIGGGHHGYGPLGSGRIGESLLDSPPGLLEESLLACGAFFPSAHVLVRAARPYAAFLTGFGSRIFGSSRV